MPTQVAINKREGAQFEAQFAARCGVDGLKALKNPLAFKYLKGGRIQPIRCDLDYRVLRQDGRVAFIDTKCFDAAHFTYGMLETHQIQRAICYAAWQVPAGFVVYLKGCQKIVYYTGATIGTLGPRTRFTVSHGHVLGVPYDFDTSGIFRAHGL